MIRHIIPKNRYDRLLDRLWMEEFIRISVLKTEQVCETLRKFYPEVAEDVTRAMHYELDAEELREQYHLLQDFIWSSLFGSFIGPLNTVALQQSNAASSASERSELKASFEHILKVLRAFREKQDIDFSKLYQFAEHFCSLFISILTKIPLARRRILMNEVHRMVEQSFLSEISDEELEKLLEEHVDVESFFCSANTPEELTQKLHDELKSGTVSPAMKATFVVAFAKTLTMVANAYLFMLLEFVATSKTMLKSPNVSDRTLFEFLGWYMILVEVCFLECGIKPCPVFSYPYRFMYNIALNNLRVTP